MSDVPPRKKNVLLPEAAPLPVRNLSKEDLRRHFLLPAGQTQLVRIWRNFVGVGPVIVKEPSVLAKRVSGEKLRVVEKASALKDKKIEEQADELATLRAEKKRRTGDAPVSVHGPLPSLASSSGSLPPPHVSSLGSVAAVPATSAADSGAAASLPSPPPARPSAPPVDPLIAIVSRITVSTFSALKAKYKAKNTVRQHKSKTAPTSKVRVIIPEESRQLIRLVYEGTGKNKSETVRRVRVAIPTFARQTLFRWVTSDWATARSSGTKPLPASFIEATIANLVCEGSSAFFSYESFRDSAKLVRQVAPFRENLLIQSHTFSNGWVKRCIDAVRLSRMRITSTVSSKQPEHSLVQAHMVILQSKLAGVPLWCIINADETPCNYRYQLAPKFIYLPTGTNRPTFHGGGNEKLRITAHLAVEADGAMLPWFGIVKNATNKHIQKSSLVLEHLVRDGLTRSTGWTQETIKLTVAMRESTKKDAPLVQRDVERPYLFHAATGAVVVAQPNAWQDTVTCAVWVRLVVKPWAEKARKRFAEDPANNGVECKLFLVWDNFSVHACQAVKDELLAAGVTPLMLYANTTSTTQPLDIGVNATVKAASAAAQTLRANAGMAAHKHNKTPGPFFLPATTLSEGLMNLHRTVTDDLSTPAFRASVAKSFVNAGLAPLADGKYVPYDPARPRAETSAIRVAAEQDAAHSKKRVARADFSLVEFDDMENEDISIADAEVVLEDGADDVAQPGQGNADGSDADDDSHDGGDDESAARSSDDDVLDFGDSDGEDE